MLDKAPARFRCDDLQELHNFFGICKNYTNFSVGAESQSMLHVLNSKMCAMPLAEAGICRWHTPTALLIQNVSPCA